MTTTEPGTSWDLVAAAQTGDRDAFGQLYGSYHDMVFRYILFRTSDRQLAEDLTAETFLRALRRIESVSYQGRDIGAWFVTIARNLILDHVKSSRYRLERTTAEIQDVSPRTVGPDAFIPEQRAAEDASVRLDQLISGLTGHQWTVIRARFYAGLSVADTAQLMGCTVGAAKAAQHRAVKSLARRSDASSVAEFVTPGEPR